MPNIVLIIRTPKPKEHIVGKRRAWYISSQIHRALMRLQLMIRRGKHINYIPWRGRWPIFVSIVRRLKRLAFRKFDTVARQLLHHRCRQGPEKRSRRAIGCRSSWLWWVTYFPYKNKMCAYGLVGRFRGGHARPSRTARRQLF